jgi:hypothetical protein
MSDLKFLRTWNRREYLRLHSKNRRAADREAGARRIDVVLKDDMLGDYDTVRRYLAGMNRWAEAKKTLLGWPIRVSDTEIIRTALRRAAVSIREDDDRSRKSGMQTYLDE